MAQVERSAQIQPNFEAVQEVVHPTLGVSWLKDGSTVYGVSRADKIIGPSPCDIAYFDSIEPQEIIRNEAEISTFGLVWGNFKDVVSRALESQPAKRVLKYGAPAAPLLAAAITVACSGGSASGQEGGNGGIKIEPVASTATAVPPTPEPTATPAPLVIPDITRMTFTEKGIIQVKASVDSAYNAVPNANGISSPNGKARLFKDGVNNHLQNCETGARAPTPGDVLAYREQGCIGAIEYMLWTAQSTGSPIFVESAKTILDYARANLPAQNFNNVLSALRKNFSLQ